MLWSRDFNMATLTYIVLKISYKHNFKLYFHKETPLWICTVWRFRLYTDFRRTRIYGSCKLIRSLPYLNTVDARSCHIEPRRSCFQFPSGKFGSWCSSSFSPQFRVQLGRSISVWQSWRFWPPTFSPWILSYPGGPVYNIKVSKPIYSFITLFLCLEDILIRYQGKCCNQIFCICLDAEWAVWFGNPGFYLCFFLQVMWFCWSILGNVRTCFSTEKK